MSKYRYKALKDNTEIVDGEIEANSLREARELIRKLGFIPTKIYTETTKEDFKIVPTEPDTAVKSLTLQQKITFTSELEIMLSSGISILEALESIETNITDLKIKKVCKSIRERITLGSTFAEAVKSLYSEIFGAVYVALVTTGEKSGELELTLQRMLVILKKQLAIKEKINTALIYPKIVVAIMVFVFFLFGGYVFPKFASFMTFNGTDLPILMQIIMGVPCFLKQFWWLVIMIIGAGYQVIKSIFQSSKFKKWFDEFVLKIPIVSDFVTYVNLSNFMTVLYISYDAGVTIPAGLELAIKTVNNTTIKSRISNAIKQVRAGKTLAQAFELTSAIPHALLPMIFTGEKSGSLGKMMKDAADVIDKKVNIALEAMPKIFEPLIILILGVFVLILAIAFIQAYAGMFGSLGYLDFINVYTA
jgi:type II secretory pathway component PulF